MASMDQNPYAPPRSLVADSPAEDAATQRPPLFAVSLPKLIVLSIFTLGLYELY